MQNLIQNHRLGHLYARAALPMLVLCAALALAGCLPLQFGFEPRLTSSPAATEVAARTHTPASATLAAPIASATLAPVTLDPQRTPSSAATVTVAGTPARDPVDTPAPYATELIPTQAATSTRRPASTPVDCGLTHVVQTGERLFQIGTLYGVDWRDIASLNGLTDPGVIFAGQVLCLPPGARTPVTPTRTPTPTPSPTATATTTGTATATPQLCATPPAWFFTPAPDICPTAAVISSNAAAQRFEHGQMLWLAAVDDYFVLYDGGSQASPGPLLYLPGPLALEPGASPDNRVPETPPPGLEQPVSGFGLIWRGEVNGTGSVRASLGWATQSEFGFTTSYQCQASATTEWHCYLRAANGQVLHLFYTPQLGYHWQPL
jgi:LysM repeat protein